MNCLPPDIQKGISEPISFDIRSKSFLPIFKSQSLFNPTNVAAASVDPPAKPAPIGIFFSSSISTPNCVFPTLFLIW